MLSLPTQPRKMPSSLASWRLDTCSPRTCMCSLPPLTMSCDSPQTCLKSLCYYLCPVSSEKSPHLSVQVRCPSSKMLVTTGLPDFMAFRFQANCLTLPVEHVQCEMCTLKGPKFQALVWHIMIEKFWTIFGVWISESGMSKLCTFPFFKQFLFCSITSIEENNVFFLKTRVEKNSNSCLLSSIFPSLRKGSGDPDSLCASVKVVLSYMITSYYYGFSF